MFSRVVTDNRKLCTFIYLTILSSFFTKSISLSQTMNTLPPKLQIAVCDVYIAPTNLNPEEDTIKSLKNHEIYTNLHKYTYVSQRSSIVESGMTPVWNKVALLLKLIDSSISSSSVIMTSNMIRYDWIVWIDSDAIIINMNTKVEDIIQEYASNSTHFIFTGDTNAINTGVMIFRNCDWTRNFLQTVWNMGRLASIEGWVDKIGMGGDNMIISAYLGGCSQNSFHKNYTMEEIKECYARTDLGYSQGRAIRPIERLIINANSEIYQRMIPSDIFIHVKPIPKTVLNSNTIKHAKFIVHFAGRSSKKNLIQEALAAVMT